MGHVSARKTETRARGSLLRLSGATIIYVALLSKQDGAEHFSWLSMWACPLIVVSCANCR
jgi:hypothetical protein